MNKHCQNPFVLSFAGHMLLLLVFAIWGYFDGPQLIQVAGGGMPNLPNKPIIQAGLINNDAVKTAVARQEKQKLDQQKKLALQKAKAEQLKQEAVQMKAEAEKLKQEVADKQKKVEAAKQLAMVVKADAEKARLQAVKEQEQATIAKAQAVKKIQQAKQAKLQAAKEHEQAEKAKKHAAEQQAANEEAKVNAQKAKQAQQAAQAAAAAQAAGEAQRLAARNSWLDSEFTKFVGDLQQRVYNNRTLSLAFGPELVCRIQIKLLPDGSVHDVKITQSSGNVAYDAMSEAAIRKAAPFDMPEDLDLSAKVRDLVLEFTNEDNG